MANLGRSSVASGEFRGRSRGPAKDTPMPKSALVMSEYLNNLMRNQCMEQCAIYTILPVGPTWDGFLAQSSPFGYSWIQCFLGRKLLEGPSGVCGIRYSVMRIFGVDWLCRGSELPWWRDICNVGYGGR